MSKVSVILLCYNQGEYVEESIRSVLDQDYGDIELIVVDDASTDSSSEIIQRLSSDHDFVFIQNDKNLGNCKSFNIGFNSSKGDLIIDLAADDYFLPGKIKKQVEQFSQLDPDYGVVFSNAEMIDKDGKSLGTHFEKVKKIKKFKEMPEGFIFPELLERFIVSAATQMIKREVLEELEGFDETLSYEDFDFWIRSSKKWKYAYLHEPLMVLRKLPTGMSAEMYGPSDPKVESTYRVVIKAAALVENERDKEALLNRIKYEMRMSFSNGNKPMLEKWFKLYQKQGGSNPLYSILHTFRK